MWDRLRKNAFRHRGYRGFNTLDRIAIAAVGLGGALLLVGLLFELDELGGPGAILLILALLTLIRAFPGSGG